VHNGLLTEANGLLTKVQATGDVTNVTFLLFFFFDMHLLHAFYFTYVNMSLPAEVHESLNTCETCVCLMVNTPFPPVLHMFNMLIMHVHACSCYLLLLFKPVVGCSISLASH
jgi:hypothetical protein